MVQLISLITPTGVPPTPKPSFHVLHLPQLTNCPQEPVWKKGIFYGGTKAVEHFTTEPHEKQV